MSISSERNAQQAPPGIGQRLDQIVLFAAEGLEALEKSVTLASYRAASWLGSRTVRPVRAVFTALWQ